SVTFPLPPVVPRVNESRAGEERVALPLTAEGVVLPAITTSSPAAGTSLIIPSLAVLPSSPVLRFFQAFAAITPAYNAKPNAVSGPLSQIRPRRASSRHCPPRAAAPTRCVEAAIGAPLTRANALKNAAPRPPRAVSQVHR